MMAWHEVLTLFSPPRLCNQTFCCTSCNTCKIKMADGENEFERPRKVPRTLKEKDSGKRLIVILENASLEAVKVGENLTRSGTSCLVLQGWESVDFIHGDVFMYAYSSFILEWKKFWVTKLWQTQNNYEEEQKRPCICSSRYRTPGEPSVNSNVLPRGRSIFIPNPIPPVRSTSPFWRNPLKKPFQPLPIPSFSLVLWTQQITSMEYPINLVSVDCS